MSRPNYIRGEIPIYTHRDGDGANRIRFLAWQDSVDFVRRLWIHKGLGACLQKNWHEPCPICEEAVRLLNEGGGYRALSRQGILLGKNPRMLAQIIDRNNEEVGVQVWDVSGSDIEIALITLSVHKDTGLIVPWTDPEYGCDLIYDYDSTAENPKPQNLRRSWPSKLNVDLYHRVMQDLDDDVIQKPTYEGLVALYTRLNQYEV
jgi:hypothetical protein